MTDPSCDRRRFLGLSTAAVLGSALCRSLPAQKLALPGRRRPPPPTLVVVYLRGGNDALNTVVPWTNKVYYDVRPRISIPATDTPDEPGVLKLDANHGFHPAMAPLMPFWEQKRLAAVLNVGSPHPTRSHFDAQDFMETAAPGDRTLREGWLNRYLQATRTTGESELRALAFQELLPRSLRGAHPVLAVPSLRPSESEGLLDLFDDVYKSDPAMEGMEGALGAATGREEAVAVGRHTIETLRRFWEVAGDAEGEASTVEYPAHPFGHRLRLLARVIKKGVGLEVAGIDLGGWDHHQGEGSTDGLIQRDLGNLASGLAAFAADLGPFLDRVLVLVMTEFGRTVAENGNRGTDHGRGGLMLALGGPVAGGRIYGSYGSLEAKELADGRDLPVTIDFRTVFHESLNQLYGFTPPKSFFPLWTPKAPLGLVRKVS
jgi:uncharacterized protein (DUF1501 family)